MLPLGIACKQSLHSLTRICFNFQFSIFNSLFPVVLVALVVPVVGWVFWDFWVIWGGWER